MFGVNLKENGGRLLLDQLIRFPYLFGQIKLQPPLSSFYQNIFSLKAIQNLLPKQHRLTEIGEGLFLQNLLQDGETSNMLRSGTALVTAFHGSDTFLWKPTHCMVYRSIHFPAVEALVPVLSCSGVLS